MMRAELVDAKTRQGWFKRYTDANRGLIHALKAREEKDWQKQLAEVKEYRRKAADQAESEIASIANNDQSKQATQT